MRGISAQYGQGGLMHPFLSTVSKASQSDIHRVTIIVVTGMNVKLLRTYERSPLEAHGVVRHSKLAPWASTLPSRILVMQPSTHLP